MWLQGFPFQNNIFPNLKSIQEYMSLMIYFEHK